MTPEISIMFIFMAALIIPWIIALIDIIRAKFEKDNDKIVWLLLVILLPFVGTILYFLIGQKKKLDNSSDLV